MQRPSVRWHLTATGAYQGVIPPLTQIVWPVTNDDSSLAR
jgi:hypothetical protein